jgi:putative DNA primase/helicase
MTTFAEKAQPLIARGAAVFPCGQDKRPLIKGGFKAASSAPDLIAAWGHMYPNALVAMPTGGKLLVLDIDVGHASGADGFATLEEKGWKLPTTRQHKTRSGGAHVCLRVPDGMVIPSSAGKLGPGLDIRAEGGYIIRWDAEGFSVENAGTIAPVPQYLLDALAAAAKPSNPFGIPETLHPGGVDNSDLGDPDAPLGLSLVQISDALCKLDPNMGYDGWLRVGLALRHECGEDGFALWNKWSSKGTNYPGRDILSAKWQTFTAPSGAAITMRSVLKLAQPTPSKPNTTRTGVELLCATGVESVPVQWLWHGWLARGKLTILAGDAGTGKTTLALSLAATVTTGGKWPDGVLGGEPGNVVVWSGEDDYADTIKPRLAAAGADMSRVFFVRSVMDPNTNDAVPFDPARDIPELESAVQEVGGVALMLIDPIVSAVAGDMHRANDVRRSLQSLVNLAEAQRCAVLGITHFSKGSDGASPQSRVIGSQAFAALARTVLVAAKQEGADTRVLARAKNNLGLDDGGVGYSIEPTLAAGIHTTRALWGDVIEGTAREILGTVEQSSMADTQLEDAKLFLADLLVDGPLTAKQIKADVSGAGHSWATVRRAQKTLGVIPSRQAEPGRRGGGEWVWALPNQPKSPP